MYTDTQTADNLLPPDTADFAPHGDYAITLAPVPDGPGLGWRVALMAAALRCDALDDGTPSLYLMGELRRILPQASLMSLYQDAYECVRVLRGLTTDWEELIAPTEQHKEKDGNKPEVKSVCGWWRGRVLSDTSPIEIVLSPSTYASTFILIGQNSDALCQFARQVEEAINGSHTRCRVYTGSWSDDPDMEKEIGKVSWGDIVLPPDTLSDIEQTVQQFFDGREIFSALKFPWRRGILLVGPPGTGKTMVCKAAAATAPTLPFLYISDIGRRNNGTAEIEEIFQYARKHSPCILAFEDVDGLIDPSRRTVFLNELDGFKNNDGLLIIASSNHPERIDEALLKRPSRFDRVYHIGLPARAEREEYMRRVLSASEFLAPGFDIDGLAKQVADRTEGFTPAFLKEAYLSAALQMAHRGKMVMDGEFFDEVLQQVETLRSYLKKAANPAALNEAIGTGEGIGFRANR